MKYLSRLDEMLLLSVWRLKDNAYGVPIIQEIKERTGRTLSPGALWVSMENLYKRGLVEKRLADSTSEIGGRGKIYYNLTLQGKKELNSVLELNRLLWEDISGFITEKA